MAKKYYEGTDYNLDTNWGGDESTGGLPLPGSAVQDIVRSNITDLKNSKVGYIRENESEGKVYFYASQEAYNNGETAVGSVMSTARYSMSVKVDDSNKYVFLSNDTKKEFTWYFKTVEIATNGAFVENVSVEYSIKNEAEGIDTLYSTTLECVQDPRNENYTKVTMNLDEYLTNGKSTIGISVRGLNTKQSNALQTSITIITLAIEDRTDFSTPVTDNFIAVTDITCTKAQEYFYEYRIDEMGEFIFDPTVRKGTGSKDTINYYVSLADVADGKHVFEYRIFVKIDSDVEPYYTDTQRIEFIKGSDVTFAEPQILLYSTYSSADTPKTEDGDLIINGVSQYIPYTLKYAVYNSEVASTNVEFIEVVNGEEMAPVSNTVENNKTADFDIQAMEPGEKHYKIVTKDSEDKVTNGNGRYFFMNVESSTLNIGVYDTNLRVDFSSVGKSNDSQDKDTWVSTVGSIFSNRAAFNNDFDWSQGWTDNGLVISEGCEVTFDYAPFPQQKSNATIAESNEFVGGDKAYTFEIEFMTQNVTDENAVVCDMMDETEGGKCGLLITGSQIKFTTPNGESVSTRFKAEEMNRATIIVRPRRTNDGAFKGLVELYINGAISNIAKYTETEKFEVFGKDSVGNAVSKNLTFRGTAGADIVVKYIRTYNGAMSGDDVVNNYIVYRTDAKQMLNLYNKNNVINDSGIITPQSVIALGNIPIVVFVGRTNEAELAYGDGNKGDGKGNCDEEYVPGTIGANEENWYQTLENTTNKKKNIDMDVIYYNPLDKSKNFKFIKAYITPQGTSSMYYPKKNYRIYTQKNKDTRCFFSNESAGVLEFEDMMRWNFGETEEDRKWEKWRGKDNYKKRKYAFKDNAQPVKCWCLKADFAETSSSHNTGVARLWGETLRNSTAEVKKDTFKPVFKTNAQATTETIYNNNINGDMPDVRTTIDGFPIVVFGKKSYSDEYVFLGKYNFNNDKSTESVFGFCDIDNENELTDNGRPTIADQVFGDVVEVKHTLDDMLDQYMSCVETLDNGNALANFSTIEEFDEKWEDAFEFRYPEIVEEPDPDEYKDSNGNWTDKEGYDKDYADYLVDLEYWKNTHLKPFKHFAQWLIDTRWCDVDGNILPGLSEEEAARRKEKFATEKWDHLDVWKMAAYYIYAMRFGAVDQIVKNSMLTSEGPFAYNKTGDKYGYWDTTDVESPEYGRYYKWYYINYDNDTVLGVKNDGSLAYGPEINRRMKEGEGETASYIYAGSTSTLWNNFDQDEEFQEIVRIADQGISKTMTYKKAISMFDDEQVGKWCERIYNKDADYKYLSPYIADWTYTGDDDKVESFVDKLFMLQGPRTAHRRWWMSKRFSLFDGKWNSGDFATKFVEVKCDYGAIGDTFSAVAGANAYFGYQINNKIFDVNEGEPEYMGGATTEFAANDAIDWKLYKNIQIGDPIAIFGSTDMLELNLGGLSKNLSSVVFNFGSNTDITNKLETLNVSVPDEWLFSNASYEIYSDDAEGTVNWKSGYDKIKLAFPDLITSEADFEEGGKYPTSDVELEATADSPMFYRTEVEGVYVYFAKKTGGIRNYSCKGISFDSLDKLQDLRMAGYMSVPSINLSNNKFINRVDVRYSNISNITFSEGARVKELKASAALSELSFTRCNNMKLKNIMIDSVSLRDNGGKNFNRINIDNSDGLNHDNEFKTFILKWIIGGNGYKANADRELVLKGINWTNVTIENIKTILEFAEGDALTGGNRAKECIISGTIEMAQENLSQDDIALIEKFKSVKGIDVLVKISFANIFINGPERIIAGDPNAVFSAQIYPENIELGTTKINFKVTPKDPSNPRVIGWSWKEDGEKYNGQLTQMYLTSEETTQESVEVEVTAQLVSEGGSDETNTKQISMTTLVEKPTYPSITKSTIEGNLTIKLGNTYTFKVNNLDANGKLSTGTYTVDWSCSGEGVDHVTTAVTGNDLTITVIKDIEMTEGAEPAKSINLVANVMPKNGDAFELKSITQVLSDAAVISRATHPEIMDALTSVMGWDESKFAMSRQEAAEFTNENLVALNAKLIGLKHTSTSTAKISFAEFAEFTNITELPNNFFADSDLSEIALPNSLTNMGKVNGYNNYTSEESQGTGLFSGCTKLTKIVFPSNEMFDNESTIDGNILKGVVIPDYFCYGCTSLSEMTLPKGTVYVGNYTFGLTNITEMTFPSTTRKLGKVFAANDEGTNTVIETITIPAWCTTLDYTAFQAESLKSIKIDDSYVQENGEVYVNPYYSVDGYGCLISYSEIYGTTLVRMPSLNEVYDEDGNLITEYDFSSTNFSYNIIGVNAFRGVVNATKIIVNGAKWTTQAGLLINENPSGDGNLIKSGENYSGLFENCPNLTDVIVNVDYVVNGSFIPDRCFANSPKLSNIKLADGFEYVGEYAFFNNAITELVLPSTIKTVSRNFVAKCDLLENIVLSEIMVSLAGVGGHLISELPALKTVTLPYLVNDIPNSFIINCPLLNEFILPDGYATYGYNDVLGSDEIVVHADKVEMDAWLATNTGYTQCNGYVIENGIVYSSDFTRLIKVPFDVTTVEGELVLNENLVEIGISSCYGLTNTTSVVIPNNVTAIYQDAFMYSTKLNNVVLPENLSLIGNAAFLGCSQLTAIEFPQTDISFGTQAFADTGIVEIVVPDTVTSVGNQAFYNMPYLTKVVFGSGVTFLGVNVITLSLNISELWFKTENAPNVAVNAFPDDNRAPGYNVKGKVMYVPLTNSGYGGGEWDDLLTTDLMRPSRWEPFTLTPIDMSAVISEVSTYSLRKPSLTVTLYNEGTKFTAQEMYLIHTATGNKVVGVVENDHYVMPDSSKLYVGETYAVMISLDGLSYTFNELITMSYDKLDYEVDSVNGMTPYNDPTAVAVASMALDDMGVGQATTPTVSKYEYDVLAAKVAYLENLIKKL